MDRIPARSALRTSTTWVVPHLLGWRTYLRALGNLLIFGLVALAATWVVHQIEYLIEYGDRFGAVMASTPHRVYMAPVGVSMTAAMILLLGVAALTVHLARQMLRRSARSLPPRLVGRTDDRSAHSLPWRIVATTLVLAACQSGIYLLQENLESLAQLNLWPGFAVLVAPQHATVLPLHLVMALCSSVLLWTLAGVLHRSRRTVELVRLLIGRVTRTAAPVVRLLPTGPHVPNLRLVAGVLSLRSPPAAT